MIIAPLILALGFMIGCGILTGIFFLLRSTRYRLVKVTGIIALLLLGYLSARGYHRSTAELIATDRSPDGQFALVVYRIPMFWCMPGGGSDAPAIVRLMDSEDRVIRETDVDMVQSVGPIEWNPDSVSFNEHCVEWKLPKAKKK